MKIKVLLVFALLCAIRAQAQTLKPTVDRAAYFDISPPLREMVKSLPQKADKSWKNGVVKNFFFNDTSDIPGQGGGPVIDPGIQEFDGTRLTDTTVINVEGLGNVNGSNPPDTDGDAGPDHYFQTVNTSYAIYNKSGVKIFGPFNNSSVWNGMPNNANSGDAIVLYDEAADRWFFTQFSFPNFPYGPYFQMIAVSQTPDPTGSWYRWQYEFSIFNDYPKFGVWPDGYYMSCNHINLQSGAFAGAGAYAFDRTAMLAGDPLAQRISFLLPPSLYGSVTLLPADCDGTFPPVGTPGYFAYIKPTTAQHLGIYEFHADWGTPPNSTFGNNVALSVNPFSIFPWTTGIPQPGTATQLDHISDRLMCRLQYRKFTGYSSMVVNHTVKTSSGTAGIRWYELRNTGSGWMVHQQATYAPADNLSRWMGSMAMDTAGSIALGYSVSGSTIYPGIRYTGRLKNDPLNQMTIAERVIFNGTGSQTGSGIVRWGDYSTMRVDPGSPTTFWYSTEYFASSSPGDWKTRIAAFTFSDVFSAEASATPAIICTGNSSQLDVVAWGGSSAYSYSWTSVPPGFTSNQKNPLVTPGQSGQYIVTVNDGNQVRTDTTKITVNQHPVVFAGNDTTVCWYTSPVEITGQAENYRMITWYSSGDGTFSNPSSLTTAYYPGMSDKTSGGALITLIALPLPPCQGNVTSNRYITLDPCTGIAGKERNTVWVEIYPNPAHKFVFVKFKDHPAEPASIKLIDQTGTVVYFMVLPEGTMQQNHRIDLGELSNGSYILQVRTGRNIKTEKLIINTSKT